MRVARALRSSTEALAGPFKRALMLQAAIAQFNLSGRGYDRTLKVSRTIADLEGAGNIEMHHSAEAINSRAFDRKLFG